MNITLIAAMDRNNGIGFKNTIPWMGKSPSDMKYFKEVTMGHPVIMGRNTYLSMGKALSGRTNIILSRSKNFYPKDTLTAESFDRAIDIAQNSPGGSEIFVIGGAETYKATLPFATRLMITMIDEEFQADTYFPLIDMQKWHIESEKSVQNDKDQFALHFTVLLRKTTP